MLANTILGIIIVLVFAIVGWLDLVWFAIAGLTVGFVLLGRYLANASHDKPSN